MWLIILFLGAFSTDPATAEEIQHENCILNFGNETLQSVKPIGGSFYIDLSGLKLQKIDGKAFDSLSEVRSLNLSSNELEKLPSSIFSKLTQLETLSLANNKIDALEKNTFKGLDKLKSLNISHNSFRHLPKGVFHGLTRSVNIIGGGNNLFSISTGIFMEPNPEKTKAAKQVWPMPSRVSREIEIPLESEADVQVKICKTSDGTVESVEELKEDEALGNCTKAMIDHQLRSLYLRSLGLGKFQKGWYKLSAFPFKVIDFQNNSLTEITPELLNDLPEGLTTVYLGNNKIEMIGKNVANRHIEFIDMTHNNLSTIEKGALDKTKLIQLLLGQNSFKSLAFAETLPPTLQKLVVTHNAITEIPENSLVNLKNLSHIDLSFNNVTHLAMNTFGGLKKLVFLDLSHNRLNKIHPGTFKDQGKMKTLHLAHNRMFNVYPGVFKGLKQLKTITLSHNKIKRIFKDSFSDLTNKSGSTICLGHNEIETIENGSFADVGVRELHLGNNRISTIPKAAFDTRSLTHLYLEENLLTMIDENTFSGLPNLRQLKLQNNEITSIKKGIVKNLGTLKNLDLSGNPINLLENGALYGMRQATDVFVAIEHAPITVIQGGVFEDI